MKLRILVLSALALSLNAPLAQAQQWPTADPTYSAANPALDTGPEGFGAPGQIVISSDFDLDLRYSKLSGSDNGVTTLHLAPALMFFVARNVALGGLLVFEYQSQKDRTDTDLGIGPLLGYHIGIAPRLSLLPTLGLTYVWAKDETDVQGGQMSGTGDRYRLIVRLPVLFHPLPHVFVGLAPYYRADFRAKYEGADASKQRTFGVTLDLGFWL